MQMNNLIKCIRIFFIHKNFHDKQGNMDAMAILTCYCIPLPAPVHEEGQTLSSKTCKWFSAYLIFRSTAILSVVCV